MRYSELCPKCQSNDIARVEGRPGGKTYGNYIQTRSLISVNSGIEVIRFVCLKCGFSEEWIESRSGLERLRNECGRVNPYEQRPL